MSLGVCGNSDKKEPLKSLSPQGMLRHMEAVCWS